jgi:hypothetical protein
LNHGQRNAGDGLESRPDVIQNQDAFQRSGNSPTEPDFICENHGSIFLLQPVSPAANSWAQENLPIDRQMFGGAVVVEHRYIWAILEGLQSDGLTAVPR